MSLRRQIFTAYTRLVAYLMTVVAPRRQNRTVRAIKTIVDEQAEKQNAKSEKKIDAEIEGLKKKLKKAEEARAAEIEDLNERLKKIEEARVIEDLNERLKKVEE